MKKHFQELFENAIDTNARARTFSILLRIHYRSSSIYLAMGGAKGASRAENTAGARAGLADIFEGLESLLRLPNREINLEKIELGRFKIEIQS